MRFTGLILFIFLGFFSRAQPFKTSGNWSGIITDSASNYTLSYPVLLTHEAIMNFSNGFFRIESNGGYIQYEVTGKYSDKKNFLLKSGNKPIKNSKGQSGVPFQFYFSYDDSSGYITSTFNAPGSPFNGYKVYLERDEKAYEMGAKLLFDSFFTKALSNNIRKGIPSKEKRLKELKSFQFKPILFSYNEYSLDSTYLPYLKTVARIIQSHSDIRIKIMGNTDGDGSDAFNLNLSKQRANEIEKYLNSLGITSDRIVQEFKGEGNPIDTNKTPEGKRKNRRVEIEFI